MKKLLYIFLAISIIFSACEEEDAAPANTNNNGNNNSALSIGDTYQGGIIFYLDGNGGGLIAAPSDQSTGTTWGCYGTIISGADGIAIGTGSQNTLDIYNTPCLAANDAADICYTLTLGGYNDWFLPSKDELNLMWLNIGRYSALGNIGGFIQYQYWSSTEFNNNNAWVQDFEFGGQYNRNKANNSYYVRAIRAF